MNLNHQSQNLKAKKIHFIGIGGIGMSALARFYHSKDSFVSGSDKEHSPYIEDLQNEGIKIIWTPHNKTNIEKINPDYVIYSTAITNENEELKWAKENNKNILHRSELLQIAFQNKKLISISGTHGKTTTSAMVAEILIESGLNPSAILGGIIQTRNTNTIPGNGDYFIAEADESDKSFLKGDPDIAVITNIEADHLENYPGGFEEIKKSFLEFAKKAMLNNGLVACIQDKVTKEIITKNFDLNSPKLITYGITQKSDQAMISANRNNQNNCWDIYIKNKLVTSINLKVPGEHNILNALAALGVCHLIGIDFEKYKKAIENYEGVKRRFQIILKTKELTIVDDYAHHPTEIVATIKAAKELSPTRLIVVLQPHQPKRLKDLWKEFKQVLIDEDNCTIFITDTYIARGQEITGISSQKLVEEIGKPEVKYLPGDIEQIAQSIERFIKTGDFILIMGAGNITNLSQKLLKFNQQLASKFGNN